MKTVIFTKIIQLRADASLKRGCHQYNFFSRQETIQTLSQHKFTLYRRDRAGGGFPPLFRDGNFFFFYFGYPDLSLTTQTRFSNLTILNTHKQRTDKLCLVAVANEFVALNDNRKGNFGTFRKSDLKMSRLRVLGSASKSIHLNFGLTWGPGSNLLF